MLDSYSRMMVKSDFVRLLSDKPVLVIGDIMLDNYLIGISERISPEAPVPIVKIKNEKQSLGGAGNVARSIAALGGKVTIIGVVGQDQSGEKVQDLLTMKGILPSIITFSNRQTTVKTRVMAHRQQMIRLDHEESTPYNSKELAIVLSNFEKYVSQHEIIILSDYNKGIVSKEFMVGFQDILLAKNPNAKVLIDPRPCNIMYYTLCKNIFALTPNTKETGECAGGMATSSQTELLAAGHAIMKLLSTKHLLTTLGDSGMALFLSPKEIWHIPTVGRDVFDVTGAGDTVIATFGLALSAGLDPLISAILANYAAGVVVSQVGTATVSPDELEEAIISLPQPKLACWN